jgi:hypothetical protein
MDAETLCQNSDVAMRPLTSNVQSPNEQLGHVLLRQNQARRRKLNATQTRS